MKYCVKCGKELCDEAIVCTGCGCFVDYNNMNNKNGATTDNAEDRPSFGLGVLGFFVPIAGLVLYFVYHDKTPRKAKSALMGAIIGFVTNIVFSFLYSLFFSAIMESIFSSLI